MSSSASSGCTTAPATARCSTLARQLQRAGTDWKRHFAEFEFTDKSTPKGLGFGESNPLPDHGMRAHGVNNAMALKTTTLWSQVSGDENDRDAIHQALAVLDRYHGQPNEMFSADEHYAGLDPSQGIELCAVVEAMYSLEQALAVTGDVRLADHLERISYNALPATVSGDLWAHQYDQQPNQVACTPRPRAWTSNGPESNLVGLEPTFGCCTANMHQGWPKLVASLWMATAEGGLAAVAYVPSEVTASVGDGVRTTIAEETDYPFRETVRFVIRPARRVEFPLLLRVPGWAVGTLVRVNGSPIANVQPGTFVRIRRAWDAGDEVALTLPQPVRLSRGYRDSVVVERGPLVFAVAIREDWKRASGLGATRRGQTPQGV
jgi:uncharacterized protein